LCKSRKADVDLVDCLAINTTDSFQSLLWGPSVIYFSKKHQSKGYIALSTVLITARQVTLVSSSAFNIFFRFGTTNDINPRAILWSERCFKCFGSSAMNYWINDIPNINVLLQYSQSDWTLDVTFFSNSRWSQIDNIDWASLIKVLLIFWRNFTQHSPTIE